MPPIILCWLGYALPVGFGRKPRVPVENAYKVRGFVEAARPADLGDVVAQISQHIFGERDAFPRDPCGEAEAAFAMKLP